MFAYFLALGICFGTCNLLLGPACNWYMSYLLNLGSQFASWIVHIFEYMFICSVTLLRRMIVLSIYVCLRSGTLTSKIKHIHIHFKFTALLYN